MSNHKVYLSLGTNLGDKEQNLIDALDRIENEAGKVISRSSFYYSEPWGFESDNSFVNICALISTDLDPFKLLDALKAIEKQMGRDKKSTLSGYSDRIIDIDILLFDDQKINTPELTVPHPLMTERDFVMKPLSEIME